MQHPHQNRHVDAGLAQRQRLFARRDAELARASRDCGASNNFCAEPEPIGLHDGHQRRLGKGTHCASVRGYRAARNDESRRRCPRGALGRCIRLHDHNLTLTERGAGCHQFRG